MAKRPIIDLHLPRKARWLLGLLAAWFIVHMIYISIDGLVPYKGNADIAIVLGNPVNADSSLSPWLQGRVDKAFQLYEAGRVKKIFVSGGVSENGIGEGDAMKSYLLKKNVPAGNIISDNAGLNTYFTARDFLKLNDSSHYASAILVTSFYHITRAKYIVKKLGYKRVGAVASGSYFFNDFFGMFREFFAFYEYLVLY